MTVVTAQQQWRQCNGDIDSDNSGGGGSGSGDGGGGGWNFVFKTKNQIHTIFFLDNLKLF